MKCPVCQQTRFKKIFFHRKLRIFSVLRTSPFTEKTRFDAVLYRCKNCGFVEQKISSALKRFLAAFYKKEKSFFTAPPAAHAPSARVKLNIAFLNKHVRKPIKSVLEIGAYDGYFVDLLRKNFKVKEAIGIEIMNSKNRFPHIRLIHESYPTPTVARKKFDLIVIMNVLEHVFTPRAFMEALRENLNGEGYVLIEVPNEAHAFRSGMLSFQHQHISYFTPVTIRRFLASIGFKIDALYTKDLDRMMLLVSKTKPRTSTKSPSEVSSLSFKRNSQSLLKKFKKLLAPHDSIGLYGACNFTHNILQVIDEAPQAPHITVFDGDERKKGTYMSDIKKPVQSWREIDSSGVTKVVIMPHGFTREIYAFLSSKKIRTPIRRLFKDAT